MDFIAQIQATLDTKQAKASFDSFKASLERDIIKLKLDVDFTGSNSSFLKNISKQFEFVGQDASQSFAKGFNISKSPTIKEFTAYKKEFQKQANDIAKTMYSSYGVNEKDANKWSNQYVNQNQKIYQEQLNEAKKQAEKLKNIRENIFNGIYDAKSSTFSSKLSPYENQNNDLLKQAREQAKIYDDTLANLKDHFDSNKAFKLNDDEVVNSFETMSNAAKKFENTMVQVRNTQSKDLGLGIADRSANSVRAYYEANSKAIKKYGTELKDLENRYRSIRTVEEKSGLDNEYKNLQSKISAEGLTGKSFFHEVGQSAKRIGIFANVYGSIQRVPQILNQMYQEVVAVDSAMTNLYKVTDKTSATYDKFLSNAGTNAKSLGRDISGYITQVSEWAKLGYSMNSSSELAKISSIYSNVGEVDDKTAVSDLVTVMKAYQMDDSRAIDIVDMLNELGNNYATDSASLGTGLSKMASTMALSNVSLEKSLAVLTGGVEITQDADALGNAIKVSVLRMRGQKGALEDIGEYADDVESVSKMQTQILNMTKGAVNIMDSADPTSFRDWYDVMEDISEVLPKLEQTDQANLIETLFGKNRANQGQAIIQAFQSGQIQKAYKTALTAEGSAMKEQERWLDSIEAKTQQLSAAFQELSITAINSDFAKGLLDFGTGGLEIITQLIDKFGTFKTLITSIGGGLLTSKGLGKTKRKCRSL